MAARVDVEHLDLRTCSRDELKAAIEFRLKNEGRWGAYVQRREELRAQGVRAAYRVALDDFMPYGGGPNEFQIRKDRAKRGEPGFVPVKKDIPYLLRKEMEARGEDGVPTLESVMAYNAKKAGRAAATGMKSEFALKPGKVAVEAAANGAVPMQPIDVKVDPAIFAGKTCSRTEAADWAYENSNFEVEPEDAPSKLAWVLLQDFRRSAVYRQDVYKSILVKAVAKEDVEKKADDVEAFDGRKEFDILAELTDDDPTGARAKAAGGGAEGES